MSSERYARAIDAPVGALNLRVLKERSRSSPCMLVSKQVSGNAVTFVFLKTHRNRSAQIVSDTVAVADASEWKQVFAVP